MDSFNDRLHKLILSGGEQVIYSLKTMNKSDVAATPEEVTIEEEKFKTMLFLRWPDESIHGKLFEDLRKLYFVGRYEYSETVNGAYELLVRNSRQFGGSILKRERRNFGSKRGSSGRISVIFTQERGIGN